MNVLSIIVLIFCFSSQAFAKTVRYDLTITQQPINMSGKETVNFALAVNGGIPAPTLQFTDGDDAEIKVTNAIPTGEEVSLHWHGILLPPEEDGVAYVNTPPIFKGESRTFRFKIRQHGTYWYHSHTALQEQKGVYGAIVIQPKKKSLQYDHDVVVVLSDWSDENADQILQNLRKDGDYYLYKKNTVRSIGGAIAAGKAGSYLWNEWTRMGGMDLSDVGYDAFLINGKQDLQLAVPRPGERVRLRIINAAASSYFHVSLGQQPMQVISADGVDIKPIFAKNILMGMAETYDVLFKLPEQKNYQLKATAQDGTGFASAWIGSGEKVFATSIPLPDLYATMEHSHASHADHADHRPTVETLTVDELKAQIPTAFQAKTVHNVKLVLGGDMRRYIWHINGKTIQQDTLINIEQGQVVRFTFENQTMMHHPMHLHGHFFRVLNKNGDWSPLKHTVDVPPHSTRTIEFYANEPGRWMLHCHNLFHMKTGMARVVKYSSWNPKPENSHLQQHDPHLHEHMYTYSMLEAASNHAQADFKLMRTWDELELNLETRNQDGKNFSFKEPWENEGYLLYRRWFGNFFNISGGGTLYDKKVSAMVGVGYTLPFLVETALFINHQGKVRLDVEKRFQWSSSVFTDVDFTWRPAWGGDSDEEIEVTLMYGPSWHWAAGLMLTERSVGLGAQVQF